MNKIIFLTLLVLLSSCSTMQPTEVLSEAKGVTTFNHDYWQLNLPGKWTHEDDDGTFIAISEGQQYALYITVYETSNTENRETWAEEELEQLKSGIYRRQGYNFDIVEEKVFNEDGTWIYIIDGLDKNNQMRLFRKGTLLEDRIFTWSLHDYGYQDKKESDFVLNAVLNTFEIDTGLAHN